MRLFYAKFIKNPIIEFSINYTSNYYSKQKKRSLIKLISYIINKIHY